MITGRVTYKSGFGQLGQMDSTEPIAMNLPPVAVDVSQSSLAQNPPVQWGLGEWAVLAGGAYILFAVMTTTKRGVSKTRSALAARRERLAREHEAYADIYRSKGSKGRSK